MTHEQAAWFAFGYAVVQIALGWGVPMARGVIRWMGRHL